MNSCPFQGSEEARTIFSADLQAIHAVPLKNLQRDRVLVNTTQGCDDGRRCGKAMATVGLDGAGAGRRRRLAGVEQLVEALLLRSGKRRRAREHVGPNPLQGGDAEATRWAKKASGGLLIASEITGKKNTEAVECVFSPQFCYIYLSNLFYLVSWRYS
ncbi:unnamed protein product [Urochloa humidicola]